MSMSRVLLLLAACVLSVTATAQPSVEPFDAVRARSLGMVTYWDHCGTCHGRWAHGDGPLAKTLASRPPDLTRLSERHRGTFPHAVVSRAIAGDDRAHSDMPKWALEFLGQADTPDDGGVQRRIDALTLYLEFIQYRPRK